MGTCRRLEGRVALVTGAAQGFGLAIARRLAAEGAALALLDRQVERLAAVAQELTGPDAAPLVLPADVSQAADVRGAVERVADRFGRIDILVNSAGVLRLSDVLTCSEEEWHLVLDVNLKGTFLLCQAVLPRMVTQRYGRIVNISSSAGKQGGVLSGIAYNAAKGGVLSFTKSIARQFAPLGITANAVCPGTGDTPMGRQFTDEQLAELVGRIPAGRLATPADIAGAVAYLASDDAAFVTGEMLDVNGGMVMD
ncbi:MAG TPA: SDR family NAD(P)-dependent oxidoreductase [Chloroflexota bacterium]|nr:SDR family NAD(P)-dependent oxidoreductase [Chloroflexota bacterium]